MKWLGCLVVLTFAAGCRPFSVSEGQEVVSEAEAARRAAIARLPKRTIVEGVWISVNSDRETQLRDMVVFQTKSAVREFQFIFGVEPSGAVPSLGRVMHFNRAPKDSALLYYEDDRHRYSVSTRIDLSTPMVTAYRDWNGRENLLGQLDDSVLKSESDLKQLATEILSRLNRSTYAPPGRKWELRTVNWRDRKTFVQKPGRQPAGQGFVFALVNHGGLRSEPWMQSEMTISVNGHTGELMEMRYNGPLYSLGEPQFSESECKAKAKEFLSQHSEYLDRDTSLVGHGQPAWVPTDAEEMYVNDVSWLGQGFIF
ncbi:MAG: hypothetical protein ACK4NQ_00240, partial [Fimbriimonadaceae bacterium]